MKVKIKIKIATFSSPIESDDFVFCIKVSSHIPVNRIGSGCLFKNKIFAICSSSTSGFYDLSDIPTLYIEGTNDYGRTTWRTVWNNKKFYETLRLLWKSTHQSTG